MKILPLHDHIVVRYMDDEMSAGGLHMPATDPTAPARAEVLAMGPGRYSLYTGEYDRGVQPLIVKVGSIVWVRGGKQGRKMTQDGGDVYYIVPEELMAVEVEENPPSGPEQGPYRPDFLGNVG